MISGEAWPDLVATAEKSPSDVDVEIRDGCTVLVERIVELLKHDGFKTLQFNEVALNVWAHDYCFVLEVDRVHFGYGKQEAADA